MPQVETHFVIFCSGQLSCVGKRDKMIETTSFSYELYNGKTSNLCCFTVEARALTVSQ